MKDIAVIIIGFAIVILFFRFIVWVSGYKYNRGKKMREEYKQKEHAEALQKAREELIQNPVYTQILTDIFKNGNPIRVEVYEGHIVIFTRHDHNQLLYRKITYEEYGLRIPNYIYTEAFATLFKGNYGDQYRLELESDNSPGTQLYIFVLSE